MTEAEIFGVVGAFALTFALVMTLAFVMFLKARKGRHKKRNMPPSMTWHYVAMELDTGDWGVGEAYLRADEYIAFTATPTHPLGSSPEGLANDLATMLADVKNRQPLTMKRQKQLEKRWEQLRETHDA